jgi:hypothetical protein
MNNQRHYHTESERKQLEGVVTDSDMNGWEISKLNRIKVDALVAEWEWLCHDDFDPENDPTPEQFRKDMEELTVEQLIEETATDEHFTLEEYMDRYL